MSPRLFDTHVHIQFPAYGADRDEVIRRALERGVWMANVGTTLETSREAVALTERFGEGVYATVGVHPSHATRAEGGEGDSLLNIFDEFSFRELARHPKVLAIGECGFDYARVSADKLPSVRSAQREVFAQQLALAGEVGKPLAIHCRGAYDDLLGALESVPTLPRGVAHFFSGTAEHARRLLGLGFFFSFGGVITFAREYDELVRLIPLDRILLETDAPYVAPAPHRGARNEPIYVEFVAERLAEIKGISLDETARATTENALKFFGLGQKSAAGHP